MSTQALRQKATESMMTFLPRADLVVLFIHQTIAAVLLQEVQKWGWGVLLRVCHVKLVDDDGAEKDANEFQGVDVDVRWVDFV
mmetsp:Transcript_14878/g.30655  ORF Transcript_14878/g.30655 Transcript_14878/m.30655 type:complete len:83 (+) Transcript_14878:307-555(+)